MHTPLTWIAVLAGMNILWACSSVAAKFGLQSLDPMALVFWRFASALAILLGWLILRHRRSGVGIARRDVARIVAAGLLLGASNWLWVTGIQHSYATDAALLYVVEPMWGIVLAGIILREKILWTTFAGFGCVLFGLAALSGFDLGSFGFSKNNVGFGNLLVVLGLLAEGGFSIVLKPLACRIPAPVTTASVLAVALTVIAATLASRSAIPVPADAKAILAIGYLSIICTVIGYTLWMHVMRHVPVGIMLFTIFIQPLAGPVIAAVTLGEPLDARVFTGGALLLSGMAIAVGGHLRWQHVDASRQGRK